MADSSCELTKISSRLDLVANNDFRVFPKVAWRNPKIVLSHEASSKNGPARLSRPQASSQASGLCPRSQTSSLQLYFKTHKTFVRAMGILYNSTVKLVWRLTRREVLTMDAVLHKEHTTDWRTSLLASSRSLHLGLAVARRAMQAALFRPAAGGRGARQLRILRVWRGCDRFWFSPEKFSGPGTRQLCILRVG